MGSGKWVVVSGWLARSIFEIFNPHKGDIYSSLENVVLVAKVNKNYLSHLGLHRSGLTVSSILKH